MSNLNNEKIAQKIICKNNYHCHLGSAHIFKNVGFGITNLRKNKASHCKNNNFGYSEGHLVTLLSFYSVNNSYSLQYSTNI